MFTGIIQAVGTVSKVTSAAEDLSLEIDVGTLGMADVNLGDSIAVNGVCLTVVRKSSRTFEADVSVESLSNTTIGAFKPGMAVNLEKALTLSTPLGGHLVSGHVDGVGSVSGIDKDGRSTRYTIEVAASLHKYIAAKGSITVDGVSLTVTALADNGFCLNIVPHTGGNTIIPYYRVGTKVHVEVDLIARYTERLLTVREDGAHTNEGSLDKAFLLAHGFTGRR